MRAERTAANACHDGFTLTRDRASHLQRGQRRRGTGAGRSGCGRRRVGVGNARGRSGHGGGVEGQLARGHVIADERVTAFAFGAIALHVVLLVLREGVEHAGVAVRTWRRDELTREDELELFH